MSVRIDLNKFDWNLINKEHQDGLYVRNIAVKFGLSNTLLKRAEKEGYFIKILHKMKHTDLTKLDISNKLKIYLNENPDNHSWKKKDKAKSFPCEKLKEELVKNGISFVEEYRPLIDRHFSIDIAFPDKKIGIEVNGNQHYNSDTTLKKYYQDRKDLIEGSGWVIFDIHYSKVFKNEFIKEFILSIKNNYSLSNIDYSFYIKKKKNKRTMDDYYKGLREDIFNKKYSKLIEIIEKSDVDFSKFGWAKEFHRLTGLLPQKAKSWMIKYMPEFYNEKCYKKVDRLGLSGIKKYGSLSNYLDFRKNKSLSFNENRMKILQDNNINIEDKNINKKIMNLFGLTKSGASSFIQRYKKWLCSVTA